MNEQIIYSEQIIRDGERMTISLVKRFFSKQTDHYYIAQLNWTDRDQSSIWKQHSRSKEKAMRALQQACQRDLHYHQLTRPLQIQPCDIERRHAQACHLQIVA